jgi:hypothetical protein
VLRADESPDPPPPPQPEPELTIRTRTRTHPHPNPNPNPTLRLNTAPRRSLSLLLLFRFLFPDLLFIVNTYTKDMTQAEIGVFVLLAGGRSDALFLAGDTAQAVAHGVDFRFEEVRSVVHDISGGKQWIAKPIKLHKNFRSHEGILRVANMVLEQLHAVFPYAALKMQPDTGLVYGPPPALVRGDLDMVKTMIDSNPKLKVLVRDEGRAAVQDKLRHLGVHQRVVYGLREAKGLEFADVLLLDFFGESEWQKEWKALIKCLTPA